MGAGVAEGTTVGGVTVGRADGFRVVGSAEGTAEGVVGTADGAEGVIVGVVGTALGVDGFTVGVEGTMVGIAVTGSADGKNVGSAEGTAVGIFVLVGNGVGTSVLGASEMDGAAVGAVGEFRPHW